MRIAKNLLFSGLTVLVITLAACDTGWDPPPELNLPDLDVTKSTGQATIEGKNIPLRTISQQNLRNATGLENVNIPQQLLANGAGKFSVTNGKLNFKLETPTSGTSPVSTFFGSGIFREFFGRAGSGYEITFSPATANILGIGAFYTSGSPRYYISRTVSDTDDNTYAIISGIVYFYVDADCTFSRGVINWTGTDSDGLPYTASCGAFNLPLKEGWNLLQVDYNGIRDTTQWKETYTIKIANKDVPWIIEID